VSRWWREPLTLRLGSAGATTALAASVDGDAAAPESRLGLELASFLARLDALAPAAGTPVCCRLGSEFARALIVPWHDGIAAAAQRLPFAQHCFHEVYGAAAASWSVRVSAAPRGQPALACAIDATLQPRLEQLLAARKLKLAGLRPLLMDAFNEARPRLRTTPHCWFVLCEPPWLTLLLLRDGLPQAIRRVAADESELARLLEREHLSLGIATPHAAVWLMRCDASGPRPATQLAANWTAQWLDPLLEAA
jgi:hypothetical protein